MLKCFVLQKQHLACQYEDGIALITEQPNSCKNVTFQKILIDKKKIKILKHIYIWKLHAKHMSKIK